MCVFPPLGPALDDNVQANELEPDLSEANFGKHVLYQKLVEVQKNMIP